jgi:hypothetical protein
MWIPENHGILARFGRSAPGRRVSPVTGRSGVRLAQAVTAGRPSPVPFEPKTPAVDLSSATGGADRMAKEHAFEIALVAVGVISTALVWAAFSM